VPRHSTFLLRFIDYPWVRLFAPFGIQYTFANAISKTTRCTEISGWKADYQGFPEEGRTLAAAGSGSMHQNSAYINDIGSNPTGAKKPG